MFLDTGLGIQNIMSLGAGQVCAGGVGGVRGDVKAHCMLFLILSSDHEFCPLIFF